MAMQPPIGAYKGRNTEEQFGRKEIKSYGAAHPFSRALIDACEIEKLRGISVPVNWLDVMCASGMFFLKVILPYYEELRGQKPGDYPFLEAYLNDAREGPLKILEEKGYAGRTICCTVEDLPLQEPFRTYKRITERYGLKDSAGLEIIQKELTAMRYVLDTDGIVVLGEMTAYSREAQEGIIEVHATKQRLAGRDEATEGRCYIPLPEEWKTVLKNAGFSVITEYGRFTSDVETMQWKDQFGKKTENEKMEMIAIMNQTILGVCKANPVFEKELNVRSEVVEGRQVVKLDFPIMVFAAQPW